MEYGKQQHRGHGHRMTERFTCEFGIRGVAASMLATQPMKSDDDSWHEYGDRQFHRAATRDDRSIASKRVLYDSPLAIRSSARIAGRAAKC